MKNLLVVLLAFSVSSVLAQKIKYKSVYALIETEQYEKALPELDAFLTQNPDHPSATIHRGVIALEVEEDCESAKMYFDKALNLIDQKELDKNDKYYALWNRRNLRTGKYGVALDDVRLDVEERLKDCE